MTKAEIVIRVTLAADGRLTRARSARLVDALFAEIRRTLVDGGQYTHRHFGRWTVRRRGARRGFDPHARQPLLIESTRTVSFHPAPELQSRLAPRKV